MIIQSRLPQYFLYGEGIQDVDEHFLHVETIPARSRRHDWTIRPHVHQELSQLLLIESGGGIAFLEMEEQPFYASTLIRVPANCVHGFHFEKETYGWVATISSSLLGRITSTYPELSDAISGAGIMDLKATPDELLGLSRTFGQMMVEFRGHIPGRRAALEQILIGILVAMLRLDVRCAATSCKRGMHGDLVQRFRELLEAQFRNRVAIEDYAEHLHVSRERLRAACVRVTGSPPLQLLNQRRLLEAKRNLMYTSMPITRVAYRSGFEDPAYFSRFFSKRTGSTPNDYRHHHQRPTAAGARPDGGNGGH